MPVKPSEAEEEYFARQEMQRRLREKAKLDQAMAEEEKKRLKELHFMRCPKCGMQLQEETLNEVAVDICPDCRGIWLDDGELAKLTEGQKGFFSTVRGLFS